MPAHSLADFLALAQVMPRMDGWYFLLLTSRVLHVLGSIVLLGGIFYLLMVIAPKIAAGNSSADAWFNGNRSAWAKWVGIATAVLLITGLFNFVMIVKTNQIATSYHMLGGLKILVALVIFFFAAILAGKTGLADRLREDETLAHRHNARRPVDRDHRQRDAQLPPRTKSRRRRPHARRSPITPFRHLTPDTRHLVPSMDKKAKKRIEVLRKKIAELQPRLAGRRSRPTSRTKSANSKPRSPPPRRNSKSSNQANRWRRRPRRINP